MNIGKKGRKEVKPVSEDKEKEDKKPEIVGAIKKEVKPEEKEIKPEDKKVIKDKEITKPEEKEIAYNNNGDRYEGEWRNGKAEGKGIAYNNNGDRYEGDYLYY